MATAITGDRFDVNARPEGAGVFPERFVPAVRPGDAVRLLPENKLLGVVAVVPNPGINVLNSDDGNGVTVAANSTERGVQFEELNQPDRWLGQFRPIAIGDDVPDGIEMKVDQGGKQAPLYQTQNQRGFIDNESGTAVGFDPNASAPTVADEFASVLTELYVWEQTDLYFDIENTTGAQVTVSDIRYAGYQYFTTPLKGPIQGRAVPIPIQRVEGKIQEELEGEGESTSSPRRGGR